MHWAFFFSCSFSFVLLLATGCATNSAHIQIQQGADEIEIRRPTGEPIATYHLRPPTGQKLAFESGDFFHPFLTPKGIVVTDLAPSDHPHHRGIFLGWVEMHGLKDADLWGWGQYAPVKDRRIVNRLVTPTKDGFHAINDWTAERTVLIQEELSASASATENANIIDLVYRLVPQSDIRLSQWAFSGFCLRTRKDGKITFYSPHGEVSLPNPNHMKPESDWPDAPWYAATLNLTNGKQFTAAVINHPKNPKSLWHNHRDVHMINPCIVAPNELLLKKGEPLVLRYRVVAMDGPVQPDLLDALSSKDAMK
jgi:hypothetical protein